MHLHQPRKTTIAKLELRHRRWALAERMLDLLAASMLGGIIWDSPYRAWLYWAFPISFAAMLAVGYFGARAGRALRTAIERGEAARLSTLIANKVAECTVPRLDTDD